MQNLALIAPLIILIPSIGAFINFFWGGRLNERYAAMVGSVASGSTFIVALVLLSYLTSNSYQPAIIDPPLLDGWIRIPSVNLEIPWQMRVDTLSVTMMLFVSFVGTLIHIYAGGYMHGDPRFARFFAYLNMFLAFMFILVSGNNYLMLFVGWEGVGLCSYLLIGFWWEKPDGEGTKNSNAARKAFITNRIGDFGVLMSMFLIFWTFGTLDFYKPNEVANVEANEILLSGGGHGHEEEEHGEENGEHEGEEAEGDASSQIILIAAETSAEGENGEEAGEEEHGATTPIFTDNTHLEFGQLGVFNQAEVLLELEENQVIDRGYGVTVSRMIDLGPFDVSIETMLVLITLFMLLGVAGKSAQIPLFVWLPDAMAGPTPVSALIHAATMVTAGVYIMVRSNVFFYHADLTSFIVTVIGCLTALVGGYIALGQFDIKRVLAYSTISQLGFMVAAVGIGAYPAAIFHMVTHAFFKALLFLGSGSVIHGVEHGHHHAHAHGDDHHDDDFDPQDMRNMGGLRRRMPITFWTYVIGTLALAGIWPLAGFWSKDEILADSWKVLFVKGNPSGAVALGLLLIAAGFTAFYMWRQLEMVFFGKPRTEAAEQAEESNWQMTLPLVVLAVCTLFLGFINIPGGAGLFAWPMNQIFNLHILSDFLTFSVAAAEPPVSFNILVAGASLALAFGAIIYARMRYGSGQALNEEGKDPLSVDRNFAPIWDLSHARLYWDEFYQRVFINPFNATGKFLADVLDWQFLHDYFHDTVIVKGFNAIAKLLSQPLDLGLIDGIVNGVGRLTRWASGILRHSQTGYVRVYAVALFLGVVAVIVLMLLPMIQG